MLKTKVVGMYPKTSKVVNAETGETSKIRRVVYKHILLGSDADIAKYSAYQEGQGQPVHTDETTQKPMWFSINQTGVHGVADFTADGRLFLRDDEVTMLESELEQESMPEMRLEIAREIRAIKKTRNREIADALKADASKAPVAGTPVVEATPEAADLDD